MIKYKFQCPVCQGDKFGSSVQPNNSLQRFCHDYLPGGMRCTFTWPQDDDYLYFVKNFHSKAEYDADRRRDAEAEGDPLVSKDVNNPGPIIGHGG